MSAPSRIAGSTETVEFIIYNAQGICWGGGGGGGNVFNFTQ